MQREILASVLLLALFTTASVEDANSRFKAAFGEAPEEGKTASPNIATVVVPTPRLRPKRAPDERTDPGAALQPTSPPSPVPRPAHGT